MSGPFTSARRSAPSSKATQFLVPPPSHPMSVARELVKSLFTLPAGLILRDHRGDLYRWNGISWPEIDKRDVRAAAYQLLEHAHYIDPKKGITPFAPSRRKIDDVIDALRAVVLVDSTANAPFWIDHCPDPPAHQL